MREGQATSIAENGSINEQNISFAESFSIVPAGVGGEGCRGEAGEDAAVEAMVAWLAHHVAERLLDPGSLAFYRLVAASVPLRVIGRALDLALELEPEEVRVSRAAYFTALVRPHLGARRGRNHHGRPPSPTP